MTETAIPFEKLLWQALREVNDPEFPISVVDMGLVRGLSVQDGCANIEITFTAMGCPAMEMILDDIRGRLLCEQGIRKVEFAVVWNPPWAKTQLTEEGKKRLQKMGIGV